jgi:hypothetical protein
MPACIPAFKKTSLGLLAFLAVPVMTAAAPGFRTWNPLDTATVPKTLSSMGLYQDILSKHKVLDPAARAYEVNSPFWSDGAKKKRWVLLKAGTSIGFREKDDYWTYPEAAVFVKEFSIDTIPGDSTSRVRWETRVMLNVKERLDPASPATMDTWYGYSYRWNADQTDARLVPAEGMDSEIRTWPEGTRRPARMKKWKFPSRNQCEHCHRTGEADSIHGRSILGFFTAQLNRPHADNSGRNQMDVLFDQGVLKGTRSFWNAASTPRWYGIEDDVVNGRPISIDVRARSYIAANCSGCHGRRGMAVGATFGVDLNYDFHEMEPRMELRHRSVSWPFGLDNDSIQPKYYPKTDYVNNPKRLDSLLIEPAILVPGYPQKSVILFRQLARNMAPGDFDPNRNQMPPLATYESDRAATALIQKWITEMGPNGTVRIHGGSATPAISAAAEADFQGRTLVVSREALLSNPRVAMLGLDGREVRLQRVGQGLYALPAALPKGLYYVRIGAKTVLKSLL